MQTSILNQKIELMKQKGYSVVNISADNTKIVMLKSIQNGRLTSYINANIIIENEFSSICELYSNCINDSMVLKTLPFQLKFGSFNLQEGKFMQQMKKLELI